MKALCYVHPCAKNEVVACVKSEWERLPLPFNVLVMLETGAIMSASGQWRSRKWVGDGHQVSMAVFRENLFTLSVGRRREIFKI